MAQYKQSVAYTRTFKMIDSADHFSKKTGLTCTVNISKAAAAFGAAAGAVTEIANGWYKVALSNVDTNTLGDLSFYITAAGADDTDFADQVVAYDALDAVRLGLTSLPNAAAEAAGGLYTRGSGAGQINQPANGMVDINTVRWNGTAVAVPATAGIPDVNAKNWNNIATVALPLIPTVAGRTLDVSAGGEAGLDWANVGSPTTVVDLSGTTIKTTQKVDVDTIKTNPVVNGGTVTFPTNATLASTTNITAGTITTATNLTNNNDKTGYGLSAAAVQAIWDAATAALTTVGSIGKWILDKLDVIVSTRLAPTTAGRTLDVAATGEAGLDFDNIKDATGAHTLTNITVPVAAALTTNNDKTGYTIAANGLDSAALTAAALAAMADAILDRNMATGVDSGTDSTAVRTLRQAARILRNKSSIAAGTLTVKKEDDATTSWTAAVATTAGDPISSVDPA